MGTIGNPINDSKGCGGVMRVAPVALYGLKYPEIGANVAMIGAKVAALTHTHPLGYIPSAMLSELIYNIILQDKRQSLEEITIGTLNNIKLLFPDNNYLPAFVQIIEHAMELSRLNVEDTKAIAQLGEGWVAEEALAIALYCALKYSNNFDKGIIASVNHSGDSDSTGAICGNILGAHLGVESIPSHFISGLELKDVILKLAAER